MLSVLVMVRLRKQEVIRDLFLLIQKSEIEFIIADLIVKKLHENDALVDRS